MCLIGVLNLKKSDPREAWLKVNFLNLCEEDKNMKKIRQFSETYISQTTKPIFFKFGI